MPDNGVPPGTLVMLVLRVLQSGPLHGYAIAQRIHALSSDVLQLQVEEGSLYPALQRILIKGWAKAQWGAGRARASGQPDGRVRAHQCGDPDVLRTA